MTRAGNEGSNLTILDLKNVFLLKANTVDHGIIEIFKVAASLEIQLAFNSKNQVSTVKQHNIFSFMRVE